VQGTSGMIRFLTASIAAAIVLGVALIFLGTETEVMASSSQGAAKGDRLDSRPTEIATSVDRSNKSDRLRIVQRPEHNSGPANKGIFSQHTPLGCERAFSPVADPGRPNILNYCQT
jgi:hypothetical protein